MKNSKFSQAELNNLISRAKKGDIRARNEVIEHNIPLVQSIINKNVTNCSLTNSDLIQEGVFGIAVAIEKFNPDLGFKFATYASWWIKQSIFKAISEQSYALNIPVYIQETISKYNKTKQEMEQKEEKEVSKYAVAKKMNMTEEKIDTFLNIFTKTLSIESGSTMAGNKELTLAEIIEDEKQNVEKNVLDNELKKDIKIALDNLAQKERNIIVLRFGLENKNKQTLEEIGKNYGVTKECIRQIEKKALNKMANLEITQKSLSVYLK